MPLLEVLFSLQLVLPLPLEVAVVDWIKVLAWSQLCPDAVADSWGLQVVGDVAPLNCAK